jgi:predicted secreted Zn-dependent protease
MTGGTLTKDANALYTMPYLVAAAASTIPLPMEDFIANVNAHNSHPLTLLQNEGIELENRVLNVTSFGVTWYLYFEWAEVGTF